MKLTLIATAGLLSLAAANMESVASSFVLYPAMCPVPELDNVVVATGTCAGGAYCSYGGLNGLTCAPGFFGAIDYSGAICLGVHDTTPTAGPAPTPEFEAVPFGDSHTYTTAGGVFAVRGRDGAVAGAKKGTGNNGNGVGNTGPGNQGNDKDVGNAGGAKGKAAASASGSASGSGSKSASGSASGSGSKSASGSASGSGSKSASGSGSKSASGSGSKSASGSGSKSGSKSGSSSSSEEKPEVPPKAPVAVPPASLWSGIVNGCVAAPTQLTLSVTSANFDMVVNVAEAFANLDEVVAARLALGNVGMQVSAQPQTTDNHNVAFINPSTLLTVVANSEGIANGVLRVTTTFALPGPQGDTSVTIEIPYTITVVRATGGGGFFTGFGGGSAFARQAGVAEVATAQPTPAMWMAFMGACMSVMLVSVVILAWFAYAVVGARQNVKAEFIPIRAEHAL